jgi:hypothetical protein
VGEKAIAMVQLWAVGIKAPQVLVWEKFPVATMLFIATRLPEL